MTKAEEKKHSGFIGTIIWILVLLLLILALAYVVLFHINQFTLEIRLLEEQNHVIDLGESFSDPGAEVYLKGSLFFKKGFLVDAPLDVNNQLDTSIPGVHHISYHTRWHKLSDSESRQITVVDTIPPEITLISQPGCYTILGEEYLEEGYTARDNFDGDLTAFVTRIQEEDLVIYTVADSAGNRTTISRKIHYFDPNPPQLTLLGDSTMYITAGAGFTEPGWVAMDNVDGEISHWVQVTGEADKYLAGSYDLVYSVKDSTGNMTQLIRKVIVEPKQIPKTVVPEGRVIYLTFDDGPGAYTRELLRILNKYDVKATFFVVGRGNAEILREIVNGGHAIGIHSVFHEYKTIYASPDAYFQDLLTMQAYIREVTGEETWLMRFPGGSSNTVSRFNPGIMTYLTQAVQDNGFQYFDWNVDSNDAGGAKKAEEVFSNVKAGVENRQISIVLQHDIKAFSVEAVEQIILWGLENGYQFRALDMTSPCAHHGVNN